MLYNAHRHEGASPLTWLDMYPEHKRGVATKPVAQSGKEMSESMRMWAAIVNRRARQAQQSL